METLESTFVFRHTRIRILTERASDLVDLTDGVEQFVSETALTAGFVNIQTLQPTTGIVVADTLAGPLPEALAVPAHAEPLPWAACLNVVDGHLRLTRGQRILFVERDGPRPRDLGVVMAGEGRR